MLRERQKSILGFLIRAHIRTGRPIASQELARRDVFDMSPATIRNEMQELDELGYLEQPHTSAGRVPTDKGYRFFVDYLIEDGELSGHDRAHIDQLLKTTEEEVFVKDLGRAIAGICNAFAAVAILENRILYKSGFAKILEEPEFGDSEDRREFGGLVDMLDEKMEDMVEDWEEAGERVFIGRENPWKEARRYAMIVSPWKHPRGFTGFFALMGPRRMDYEKAVSLAAYLNENEYE